MSSGLVLAIIAALAFSVTNGFHDAANAIAGLVATRVARPGQAIALASVFNILGPLLLGTAVADTIAGMVTVDQDQMIAVMGAGLTGAVVWNLVTWWFGLPSSSSHALVGGLVGAALLEQGWDAVNWGGLDGWRPVGVLGVLFALLFSAFLGFVVGALVDRLGRRVLHRATTRVAKPIRGGEWVTSAALAFSHGANDAQKTVGIIAVILLAAGKTSTLSSPTWTKVAAGIALTLGTAMGGWRIVRTIGQRIYRMRPLDGLSSSGSSAAVIFASSLVGAPVSTTQVVASSVVGIGVGHGRRRHVGWPIVREMGLAWITTLPASALLGALALPLWRWLT